MTEKEFAAQLETLGYDFFTGVPCSLIEGVLHALENHPRLPYLAAVREDVAVGLAAGAWLGGRRPAVLFQNSGLGTGLNALASLALLYRLPSLLVVTWRGYQGKDAPEHILTGAITPQLLDLLGIRHRPLAAGTVAADLAWATREAEQRLEPVAVLVPPGVLEGDAAERASGSCPGEQPHRRVHPPPGVGDPPSPSVGRPARRATRWPAPSPPGELVPVLSRYEALRVVVGCLTREPVIHANGYVCRESHAVADRPQNFYMIGSMGLAAPIGLGLAVARPGVTPVVFDGDGNLLMSLGILPMAGALAPPNFVHLVFDNEVYGSTGNQASVSREVRLDRLAAAAGYRTVRAVTAAPEIEAAMRAVLAEDGPHFVLVKVTPHEEAVPRIPYPPETIRDRFRASIGAS